MGKKLALRKLHLKLLLVSMSLACLAVPRFPHLYSGVVRLRGCD